MAKDMELLDRSINYIVAFPVTILGVLFRPSKVLAAEYEDKRCPPGVAFVIALTVWFLGHRAVLRIQSGDLAIPLGPGGDEVAKIIIGTAALLVIQALVLAALFKSSWDWRNSAKYLAYPLATAFLAWGILSLLGLHFPKLTQTVSQIIANLECRYDSAIHDCSRWVSITAGTFSLQVSSLSHLGFLVVYPWALYNVIRVRLAISSFRGVWIALLALLASVAVFATGNWVVSETEQRIKQLAKEEVIQMKNMSAPDQR